jgi:uncharacterized membrane protein YbaN (DUF454 family)
MSISNYKNVVFSVKKSGLIFFGILNVIIGAIGAFLPILPTTPFLLVAAYCFIRSSDRLYNWLINHKLLGGFIREYNLKNGMTIKAKAVSMACAFTAIVISSFFLEKLSLKLLLYFLGLVMLVVMLKIKTAGE